MAPSSKQPDYAHLFGILANTRLQQTNNALYETIYLLIKEVTQSQNSFVVVNNNQAQSLLQLLGVTYLTVNDETQLLINSRKLLAGLGITFDDTVPGRRTVNASGAGLGYWTPLTDGHPDEADLIFANGEAIAVNVPNNAPLPSATTYTATLNPPQAYRYTSGIHRRGLAANRPAATDVLVGTLYFSTDTVVLERSNGTTWDSY
jgi:hypothetical protein